MPKDKRFEIIHKESTLTVTTYIIRDADTGANYIYHGSGYGGGLTPLLGKDGKPVITTYSE